MDEELRAQLLARRDEDQRVRQKVPRSPGQLRVRLPGELAAEWERIDTGNTLWLGDLVAGQGWPARATVGEDGATAAWLLAQHADRHPALQQIFLDALRAAVAGGQASPASLAYLDDRVRVNSGQPQLYGTQFTAADGELKPDPIEDPGALDIRRAQAGLEPFASYEALLRSG